MQIETAQHINGDSYGQKNVFIYITTDLHEQHIFASFWSGKNIGRYKQYPGSISSGKHRQVSNI